MRAFVSTVTGFLAISLWSVAFVSHQGNWLAWVDAGAGIAAVVAAFAFVRGRQGGRRLMGGIGLVLVVASLVAVALASPRWLRWASFALGCSSLLVALPALSWPAKRGRVPPASI